MDTDIEMVEQPIVINSDKNNNGSATSNGDDDVVILDSFKTNILNKAKNGLGKSNKPNKLAESTTNGAKEPFTPSVIDLTE